MNLPMALYTETQEMSPLWPEPIEHVYQLLGGRDASAIAPKLPHLGLSDILFMVLIMSMPRERRPWGIATWMATTFMLSRTGLYDLTERVQERLLQPPPKVRSLPVPEGEGMMLSERRLQRTVLTAAFPGKMAIRPMQEVMAEAFGQSRSVGWISELLSEAGDCAGEVLAQVDTSPLGPAIVLRDETFFQDQPLLLVVEPVSATILFAQALPDRQADTWGLALLMTQDQGVTIAGVVEDMARMYGKSLIQAELDLAVQKDVWHLEREGKQVKQDLERMALRATRNVVRLEKQLLKQWDDALFAEHYISAVVREERLYEQHAQFSCWLEHLCDALEVVDWRSGEIRDRAINEWLLTETLSALEAIDHPRVQKWVKSLHYHQAQLLTYLDWLTASLQPYELELVQHLDSPEVRKQFMRRVARCWRLRQGIINGHNGLRSHLKLAQQDLDALLAFAPQLSPLADRLIEVLDAAARTSSMIENINGLLKQFLHNRRAFRNSDTLQNYLNLFTLWHNMRVFARGKRQGQSPYQRAGIDVGADDWLSLIGYPAAE
jgi:hypothetical protein